MKKKVISKEKQKLVYVKWQDAHSQGGWLTESAIQEEVDKNMWVAEDVGWVIYEDEREIHIVSRRGTWPVSGGSEYGMYQRIPKAWILKRKLVVR